MMPAGNEGGGRVKAEAMKRAITMATRVVSNDDGAGDGGKSNDDGDEDVGRATTRAMAAAMTVVAIRVASNEEDESAGWATTRAMAVVTTVVAMRVASDKEGGAVRQWRWWQGSRVSNGDGNEEGSGNGDESGRQGCHGERLHHSDVLF
jgi:hypothetical protein